MSQIIKKMTCIKCGQVEAFGIKFVELPYRDNKHVCERCYDEIFPAPSRFEMDVALVKKTLEEFEKNSVSFNGDKLVLPMARILVRFSDALEKAAKEDEDEDE